MVTVLVYYTVQNGYLTVFSIHVLYHTSDPETIHYNIKMELMKLNYKILGGYQLIIDADCEYKCTIYNSC